MRTSILFAAIGLGSLVTSSTLSFADKIDAGLYCTDNEIIVDQLKIITASITSIKALSNALEQEVTRLEEIINQGEEDQSTYALLDEFLRQQDEINRQLDQMNAFMFRHCQQEKNS
ncbi:hypothetical protein [Lentilitoribacter sp. EG35]|uniref:hypothetical protein n=1 Tax=Lentilitoribacter sp. EG35 TaxID=3234192 RepID=UPI003460F1FB